MTNRNDRTKQIAELRLRAVEVARKNPARSQEKHAPLSPEETEQTLHELQVHQIELEIQNLELLRTQVELDAARTRYYDLFDLAPVGYLSLGKNGLILE
ncbi:MAG: hypothetical protein WCG31_01095, partial [Deltaproteobacteria bacterium]